MNINKLFNYVEECLGNDPTEHGLNHAKRVYKLALIMAKKYKADIEIVTYASILHDVDDPKLFIGKPNERLLLFLNNEDISNEKKKQIIEIINSISYSKHKEGINPNTIEGKIVQDADRLDAIGAIGIARCFAYGGYKNRLIYCKDDSNTSINHFYDKLLRLKELMNTKYAKRIAKKRTRTMIKYLKTFYKEWNFEK